jgi:hypothetical protein
MFAWVGLASYAVVISIKFLAISRLIPLDRCCAGCASSGTVWIIRGVPAGVPEDSQRCEYEQHQP